MPSLCNICLPTICHNSWYKIPGSKVASVKPLSLPRTELLGTLLAAKLSNYLSKNPLKNLQPMQITLCSDSNIALSWISSTMALRQPFIRHRVEQIKKYSQQATRRHCSSSLNPAAYKKRMSLWTNLAASRTNN